MFAGSHLDTLAALLGEKLRTIRQIHRSVGLMAVLLVSFHTVVPVVTWSSLDLDHVPGLSAVLTTP